MKVFPLKYGVLYDYDARYIDCSAKGGITKIGGCLLNEGEKSVEMETLEVCESGNQVEFIYFGFVSYFEREANVNGFYITISYMGVIIANTDYSFSTAIEKTIGFFLSINKKNIFF